MENTIKGLQIFIIFTIMLIVKESQNNVRGDWVSRLSDVIEQFIKELIEEGDKGILEIQRNQLADYFNCAPSQINYVLSTRFSIDKGYYIESRRGGGGYIKIKKIKIDNKQYLYNMTQHYIGDSLSQFDAVRLIKSLSEKGLLTSREQKLMEAAINSKTLIVFSPSKDQVRANIVKSMLLVLVDGNRT